METGPLFMTKKKKNSPLENYKKLSIQVSLNGLSFCIVDTIANNLSQFERLTFESEVSPYELKKRLVMFFNQHELTNQIFSEVVVVHKNTLFSFVPTPLFNKDELANYLKFNVKILANDHIDFDEIPNYDLVNVYIPFVNINNYIFELFGEFVFKHNATVMVETLLNAHGYNSEPICYVYLCDNQMEITVISSKQLLFYNSFVYTTKEDYLYYLLFTMEQLKLDTEIIKMRLFGDIEMEDEYYNATYEYIKHLSIFIPPHDLFSEELAVEKVDFNILNAL